MNPSIYVLMYREEVLGYKHTLYEAQDFFERRLGKVIDWEHHDSHGRIWIHDIYNIQETGEL
jgi:hypothetical protein